MPRSPCRAWRIAPRRRRVRSGTGQTSRRRRPTLDVELLLFGSLLLRRLLLDAELCVLRVKELDEDLETRCQTSRDDGAEVTAADVQERDAESEGNRDGDGDERPSELDERLVYASVVNNPADARLDVAIHYFDLPATCRYFASSKALFLASGVNFAVFGPTTPPLGIYLPPPRLVGAELENFLPDS